jgi:hypothetical protein
MIKEEYKYYTPIIEEFHVGFEYETLSENEWVSVKVASNPNQFERIIKFIPDNKIRVKYLDKEDIESLGGIQTKLPYHWEFDLYRLIKRDQPHQYIIESMRYQDQVFVGIIKNKSELKKLLTQINII